MVTSEQLQEEAARMARAPGIVFVDDSGRRRAKVAGSGLDVEEIVKANQILDGDWRALCEAFHWLSATQLRAALAYYQQFPDEIDRALAVEEQLYQLYLRDGPIMPPYPPEYDQLLASIR